MPGGEDVWQEECESSVVIQPPNVDGASPLAGLHGLEHLKMKGSALFFTFAGIKYARVRK